MTGNGRSAPELTEWLQMVWEDLAEEDQTTRERKLEEANVLLQKNRERSEAVRAA
jgi:hypothetical protein